MQPLLADRVGLKPRITEGYERATGLVAALLRARDEKDFREWPSHIGRDAGSQARDPLRSPSWRALPLPPLLEGVAENVGPCTDFGLFPDGACRFRRACALKRMAEAVSGILPREDKATAMRVLSRPGEALGVAVGAGRFYADPQGFRLASLPSAPPMAAMTNGGPWSGRGVACPRMCSQSSWRALAGCFPRRGPWRRRC